MDAGPRCDRSDTVSPPSARLPNCPLAKYDCETERQTLFDRGLTASRHATRQRGAAAGENAARWHSRRRLGERGAQYHVLRQNARAGLSRRPDGHLRARFAAGRIQDLPALAEQLVTTKPDVIFAPVTPAALAARKATPTIPIVFAVSADPVGAGLVASLRQPGGNVTGLMSMNTELAPKRLELLKEVAPRISRVALFLNPDNVPDRQQLNALNRVATELRVVIVPIAIRGPDDFTQAFTNAHTQRADTVMIIPNPLNIQFRTRIVEFAAQSALPTMDAEDRGAREGALMSYGPSWADNFRQAAQLVDRILKGARPRDLPVEQPTKFELVINMKTAKTIRLPIPPVLRLRADQLIDP